MPDCNAIEIVTTRNAGFLIPGSGSARCCSASLSLRPADSGPVHAAPQRPYSPLASFLLLHPVEGVGHARSRRRISAGMKSLLLAPFGSGDSRHLLGFGQT